MKILKKSKILCLCFHLIDLLEVCDPESLSSVAAAEKQLQDDDGDFDEDLALIADDDHENKDFEKSDDSDLEDFGDDDEDLVGEEDDVDDLVEEEEDLSEEEGDLSEEEYEDTTRTAKNKNEKQQDSKNKDPEKSNDEESETDTENKTWTDIYGRLRGKDGSIIEESSEKYIPPAKRAQMAAGQSKDKKTAEKLLRLQRQLKGLNVTVFFVSAIKIFVSRANKQACRKQHA